jgi:hypothetical protein
MYLEYNIEPRSRDHCCRGKAVSVIYSECVSVVLVTQHAKCMRRIILSSVPCFRLHPIFPHYLRNGTIFGQKLIEHKTCVWIFATNFV